MNYLEELNPEQRVAVEYNGGPMMVIAGAGSGKTRVLTYKIAHLIHGGVDPFNILALTFTNKASREMKKRIGRIVGDAEARNIWMGTFHSVFARILRIEADRINYPSNFTIYDTQDSRSTIKSIIKDLRLDDKVYKPASIHSRISNAKNNLIGPKAYMEHVEYVGEDRQAGRPRFSEIYAIYRNRLFRAGAMDFDDLLFNTNVLLRDYNDILVKYQHKFRYILVDEYQDTNFSQYLIIKQLAAAFQNICVVGDDAQSIYAFRGANIQNILNFKNDYPDFKLFKLEQNYRSTQNIVDAANSIIEKNKEQIKKKVWTHNDKGTITSVHKAMSDNDEGYFVTHKIFEIKNNLQVRNMDFAILYRTNAQSRSFEESLRKLGIPYRIYGGLSFYQRKEVKDLIAYFRLTANPNDEEALKRIINYPARGIGKTTMEKILVAANENEVSLWDILENPIKYPVQLGSAAVSRLSAFLTMIKSFRAELETKDAYELGQRIASSSGLLRDLHADKSTEGVARYENLQELLAGMKEFSESRNEDGSVRTLGDFLLDVALLTDADADDDDNDKVSLMTIHAAKGLEFPYVFIVGLEENLFPSQLSVHSREELEEERRLFYVALTRAKIEATLSYATSRFRFGNMIYNDPSRFIDDIAPEFISRQDLVQASPRKKIASNFQDEREKFFNKRRTTLTEAFAKKVNPQASSEESEGKTPVINLAEITVGTEVIHDRFGKGKILAIEGVDQNKKATVFFPSAGQKQLLLKFAKLRVV